MMKVTAADLVVRALRQEGVKWIFGIPGTHNIELYDRMIDEPEIQPVLITDEQSSAFLADGVARSSGQLAAVNLVPGAGLTHALSGITECFLDQIPLLVLLCGIRRDTGQSFQLHDIDQASVVRPVCKRVIQPATHSEVFAAVIEACRLARTPPCGPAVVEIPANLYLLQHEVPEVQAGPVEPDGEELSQKAVSAICEELNRAKKIAIYCGLGARDSVPELLAVAEQLDAVVFTTISGKGVFPESNPRWAWNTMGRTAPSSIRDLQEDCDCLLAIGCRFAEVATGSYGFPKPEFLIHIDMDPLVLNRNYPADISLVCDSKRFLNAILHSDVLRKRTADQNRLQDLQKAHTEISKDQRSKPGEKVLPSLLLDGLQRICGGDSVFVADSGNGLFLAMEHLRLNSPGCFLAPVDYSCMGYSVPAAIGAKLAQPERPVIALAGDGAFLMTGLELATAVTCGAGVMVFLLRDRELSQIAQFQKASLERQTCTKLADYDAAAFAKTTGSEYLSLAENGQVDDVVSRAFEISKKGLPVLVEVEVDYSRATYFSKGVVITNFLRFSWKERLRLVSRVLGRKLSNRLSKDD